MWLLSNLLFLLTLGITTWALHESDVGIVDWNKHHIGVPLSGSVTIAPVFHHVGNKTIILTATGNNVLAALEPEDGSILWRYLFNTEDKIAGYYKNENTVATLSGPGGSTLRTFEALTGQLLVEKRLHLPELGLLTNPSFIGKHVILSPDSPNVFVLSNGYTVTYINGTTGDVEWSWSSPDQSSHLVYSKLILDSDAVYVVGLGKSPTSYMVHVSSLSPSTGQLIASANIASNILDPLAHLAVLSRPGPTQAQVLWIEQETLRSVGLTPTLKEQVKLLKGTDYAKIQDVGLNDQGHAVISRKDGSTFVLKIDDKVNAVKSAWDFFDSATSEANADSIYAGSLDKLGQPYVARVYWSHKTQQSSAVVFAGHLVGGLGFASGFVFPFDTTSNGIIGHVAIDSETPAENTISSRVLATTSTGAVQLWTQRGLQWSREESLANLIVAEFVELPEKVTSQSSVDGAGQGFFPRITRQLANAQDFPQFIVNFVKRFVTGSYASTHSAPSLSKSSNSTEPLLSRDTFGFRQVIVAGTAHGKIFGIDSSNGEIIWSRVFGLGWAAEVGGRVVPVKLFVTKTVADGGDPEVVIVSQRRADNTLVDTVIFHLNARTGEDVLGISKKDSILQGVDIIQGSLVEAYFLQNKIKVVALLDEFLQVYLYPETPETQAAFAKIAPSLSFPLRIHSDDSEPPGPVRVLGHQIHISPESSGRFRPVGYPTWSLSLPADEDIQTLLPAAARGPVASVGKVLGNRTTLYKYLNPRLFTVLTASPVRSMCGIYVVDSMKGTVVYHVEVRASSRGCEVKTALTENWLVYHYYEGEVGDGTAGGAKGYRMVSAEFYEGQKEDEKTKSSDMSAFSNATINFMRYEKAFIFPHAITALAPTSTKFGITARDLIVATDNRRIQSFPRRLLDPRRPHRKPTTEELEEFLIEYDPVLPNDARRVLSHNYDVANVQRIVTAPALLESTSLVLAYGLDIFLTRVAPSNTFDVLNENFNKVQLVFTVSGLILAILITKPMVQRKRLRARWYQ